ncbi:fumarylacetoacetate hydrolase family protein [Planktotalea sp.]|jgi:2-keto-4-pentenoate hydratase/2-oxohepta-3-ene-1,7-dioic acid hydratase in catechol pathway|uniref:fumarylacetoacetate hydrolase family protein n=1 Tax=Planktotalea sp. TaxID=2029877 RepID=UPI0025E16D42|nr:fumarylacetoacetate hydrolase family protein [Planktotalea sp.]
MRLATVSHKGQAKVVAATETNRLLDLRKAAEHSGEDGTIFADMLSLINAGENGLKTARALLQSADEDVTMAVSDVSFLPPIMPVQYRDCLVFEEHLANCFRVMGTTMPVPPSIPPVWYDQPLYYKGNRMSFIGHGTDVQWPAYAEFLDIELELAIVVGKTGKDISKDAAPAHIFGYSILNDVSARDAQMREMPGQLGPCKGKDFDTGNILGPYILTVDEVVHPIAVNMEARVNGERWGGGNSSQMQHSFADILAHISSSETIYAGEVIGSGTVGTGCGLEIGKRLQDGDTFELEIENIGILANRIVKAR